MSDNQDWITSRSCRRGFFALALALAVIGCNAAPPTAAGTKEPFVFRVMSYNIHHGEGLDKKLDLERIAALIRREKADLVGLQEVDKGVERTARRDLPAELAKLTGMTCVFSNNFHHQGGEYGNAILSRFPVVQSTNHHYKMLRPGEQRGILRVDVRVDDRLLSFFNTHLDYRPDDSERVLNVSEIKNILGSVGNQPAVLCGDFNCTSESKPYQLLSEFLSDAWEPTRDGEGFTIPANKPSKRIDYIFLLGKSLKSVRAWVPVSEASDHRPVVAELELRAAEASTSR